MHEWLMVSKAEKARLWRVTYAKFRDATRSKIGKFRFLEKASGATGIHGSNSISSKAHLELARVIEGSRSMSHFKGQLRRWANGTLHGYDYALEGGAKKLPLGLRF